MSGTNERNHRRNQSACCGLSSDAQSRECAMKLTITIAGTAGLTIAGSVAFADQTMTGTVTRIDRTNGTVVIQQTQDGTVGAGAGNVAEQFKTQNGSLLDAVHAGDRVTFSVTGTGDTKTITNFEKPQK